ncbi:SURF1 family protein [Pseudactinotalea sp. HY158]|uniref:SURF1 family protein n=1 Tax=Pseudactinotalea sp. HY158 TaxID=2654547 RepID=UPI001E2CC607|nr:SURF1 family protein [Pseudactinotalea sp. HY158]
MSEPSPRPSGKHWRQAALTRRMLVLLVVILAAAAVCVRLGAWQLDRAVARAEQGQAAELAAREQAAPVPIGDIAEPQTHFTQEMVGRRVHVAGTYIGPEFFVPGQFRVDPADPENTDLWTSGYWVLSGLRTDGGAVLPVVRGWVAETDPAYLNAEGTRVEAIGYLDGSQAVGDPVDGDEIGAVSSAQLVNEWSTPIYSGFIVLAESDPAVPDPAGLPPLDDVAVPTLSGGGLNLQNLAYAGEWFIFGGFAVLIWWRMVRDEARDLAAAAAAADDDAGAAGPPEAARDPLVVTPPARP